MKKLRHTIWFMLILIIPCLSLLARDSQAGKTLNLTLTEAVHRAVENNPGLKVDRYSPLIASQDIMMEMGTFDPSISFSLSESYERSLTPSILVSSQERSLDLGLSLSGKIETGAEYSLSWNYQRFRGDSVYMTLNPYHLTELTLTISQPILRGFGRDMQTSMIRVAKGGLSISEHALRKDIEELINSTVKAYYDVLIAKETLNNAEFSLSLVRNILQEVRAKIDAGLLPPVEIYKAEAEVAKREEALLKAENALRDAVDALRITLGIKEWDSELSLSEPEAVSDSLPDLSSSVQEALSLRNDLRQAVIDKENKEILSAFYKNRILPDLKMFGSVGVSGLSDSPGNSFDRLTEGTDRNWQIGLSLQIPFFHREARGRYQKAMYEKEQADASLEELRQKIVLEVRQSWRAISLSLKRIESSRKTRVASGKRLEAEYGRFREGLATLNDVLQYQEEFVESLLEEKKALYDYHVSMVEFDKTRGRLMTRFGVALKTGADH